MEGGRHKTCHIHHVNPLEKHRGTPKKYNLSPQLIEMVIACVGQYFEARAMAEQSASLG